MTRTSHAGMSPDRLNGERLQLLDEAKAIGDKAESGAELTDEELSRFNELTADGGLVEQATAAWQEAAQFSARCLAASKGISEAEAWDATKPWNGGGPIKSDADGSGNNRLDRPEPFALQDATGQWHKSVTANEPLSKKRDERTPSAGQMLAFWITQDERHLGGRNSMASVTGHGGGSDGGLLIPSTISGEFIDLARSAMVTGRAGTRSIALTSAEMKIVKVASDPAVGYVGELQTIPASRPTFSSLTLRPHKLGVLIPISREAVEDGANLPGILESTARAAVAQAVDRAVLYGTGATEPTGIINTDGVNKIETVGTPTSYANVLGAVRRIYDANFAGAVSDLGWVHSPREWETYAGLVTTGSGADGQPLQIPPKLADLPAYATTAMPVSEGAGEDESSMIVGHFPQSVVAFREGAGVRVEILREGTAADGDGKSINAVSQDALWLRFTLRFDVAVLRPDHFTVLSGVTAA